MILFNNKPAFLEPQHCYSILAESHTSLRWGIPAHTHPLHPMLLPCLGVYTAIFAPCSQLRFFQDKPSQQHALCHIVPTLGRLLKAKQHSEQHCKQPILQADLHSLFTAASCSISWHHASAWQPTPNDPNNRLSSEQKPP